MQYKSEVEKVAPMTTSYIPVSQGISSADDPQIQRTRKILIIFLSVFLVSFSFVPGDLDNGSLLIPLGSYCSWCIRCNICIFNSGWKYKCSRRSTIRSSTPFNSFLWLWYICCLSLFTVSSTNCMYILSYFS